MATATDLTARNLDIQLLQLQDVVEAGFDDFLNHYYGKRPRPDKPQLSQLATPPSQPQPSQVTYGAAEEIR